MHYDYDLIEGIDSFHIGEIKSHPQYPGIGTFKLSIFDEDTNKSKSWIVSTSVDPDLKVEDLRSIFIENLNNINNKSKASFFIYNGLDIGGIPLDIKNCYDTADIMVTGTARDNTRYIRIGKGTDIFECHVSEER